VLIGLDIMALKFQDFIYKNGGSIIHSRLALSIGGEGGCGRFIGGLRSNPIVLLTMCQFTRYGWSF